MKKILCVICVSLLSVGTLQAQDSLTLNLPAIGNHADGTVFTTSIIDGGGATYDIEFTLTAFANDEATQEAVINSDDGLSFGVASLADAANPGQEVTFDGDGNEGVEISNLSITNFVPGTDGLVAGDLSIAFETVTFMDGGNRFDGIYVSYINQPSNDTMLFDPAEDFQINRPGFIPDLTMPDVFFELPPTVDLTTLMLYDPAATTLHLNTDNTGSANRWEISELTAVVTGGATPTVVPPVTDCLLGDVNQDTAVNFADIAPFVAVLAGGGAFQCEADCNEDTEVNFADIAPFVGILASGQ